MTTEEAITAARQGRVTLIDVREAKELAETGKASGARHVPLGSVSTMTDPAHADFIGDLTMDTPIAIYCAKGGRAGKALLEMQELGYENLSNIGGLSDWIAAGGATEQA